MPKEPDEKKKPILPQHSKHDKHAKPKPAPKPRAFVDEAVDPGSDPRPQGPPGT